MSLRVQPNTTSPPESGTFTTNRGNPTHLRLPTIPSFLNTTDTTDDPFPFATNPKRLTPAILNNPQRQAMTAQCDEPAQYRTSLTVLALFAPNRRGNPTLVNDDPTSHPEHESLQASRPASSRTVQNHNRQGQPPLRPTNPGKTPSTQLDLPDRHTSARLTSSHLTCHPYTPTTPKEVIDMT